MNLSTEQIELLILDSAIESQRECVARLGRRKNQAEDDYHVATEIYITMQTKASKLREVMLNRGCV